MQKDLKFTILSEGQEKGVSITCKKYNISRTIYYRWLDRYRSFGLAGLEDIKKSFVPKNKTSPQIEQTVLSLIRKYPTYGPKSIKYFLEEMNYNISESAVFNIMKRNNLTNKENRLRFSRKIIPADIPLLPSLTNLTSGECWLFWITDCGYFSPHGTLYSYTLMDVTSKIACSRIYQTISYSNFEDLLTAVALPIAQSLSLNPDYLCFFRDSKLIKPSASTFLPNLNDTLSERGFEMDIHLIEINHSMNEFISLRAEYTKECISFILTLIHKNKTLTEIKTYLQQYIRTYNLNHTFLYGSDFYSPVAYHNKFTNSKPILPIWAYLDRPY